MRLFRGCQPELSCGPDGRILAVGPAAAGAVDGRAEVVELRGRMLPGLTDSHLHLEGLVSARLGLDLAGVRSLERALDRIRAWSQRLPGDAWVVGRGWHSDDWSPPALPSRLHLDEAAAGRPVLLVRKDGHSAWASSAALRAAGIGRESVDRAGAVVDRDPAGEPTGIVREQAVEILRRAVPPPSRQQFDRAMLAVLRALSRAGLTQVHSMDTAACFASLQRLHAAGRLPLRVTFNLPRADLGHAERMGVRSGWGDPWLRLWGVKAFLDGSLGSRTAEMLDGGGVAVLPQPELRDFVRRCAAAELNVCLHAIGDAAVRRALDALEPLAGAWRFWRPRIEHVQIVHPADLPRFHALGVVASMQPIHAVADRLLAEREWPGQTGRAYAWRALERAGARLCFGSDAPVETADPLAGLEAATAWRRRVGWHPGLALDRPSALRAYTLGAAYAVGLERDLGRLAPGRICDATVIDGGRVIATIVDGRVVSRRRES